MKKTVIYLVLLEKSMRNEKRVFIFVFCLVSAVLLLGSVSAVWWNPFSWFEI
jgi:hypothetical protein